MKSNKGWNQIKLNHVEILPCVGLSHQLKKTKKGTLSQLENQSAGHKRLRVDQVKSIANYKIQDQKHRETNYQLIQFIIGVHKVTLY